MYKLSIVIPCHNKWNFTKSCLEDLFRLPDDHQIIVWDNGSTDETCSKLLTINKANFFYDRSETNLGFAGGCNSGYTKQLESTNVMFLNNDIRVNSDHETWTRPIIDACNDNCIVSPTVGHLDGNLDFICEDSKIYGDNYYMSGWNLSSSVKNWDQLTLEADNGPFSTEFGLAYFEDTDLSFRARADGYAFKVVDVPVAHFGKVTSKSIGTSNLFTQARAKFKKKWLK